MRWAWSVVLAAAVAAPAARGQDPLLQPTFIDAGSGAQFVTAPADPTGPRADGPARAAGVRGVVGGLSQNNHTNASVGFLFLTPLWSFRDFQLAAPRQFESAFPRFGSTGPVTSRFSFVPRVNLDYYVEDLDLQVGGSGTFINLSGRVDRQAAGTDGPTGLLTGAASLTLVSANVVEFGRQFAFLDLFPDKTRAKPAVVDSVVELRVGTRYVSVEQNYTGALQGSQLGVPGTALTSRFSTQSFRGIGLTTAVNWELPVGTDFGLFSSTRTSLLLGENRRNATVSVTAPTQTAYSDTRLDNRTTVVPVVELEAGWMYGAELGDRIRQGLGPPRFLLKVAAVGQYWGGLGPLSAASTQEFRNSDLFLVGGYVQAGFRY